MKYPLLSEILSRLYDKDALSEIDSGKDLLPFPTNVKRQIIYNCKDTVNSNLMNGDTLLQAAFYDTSIRSIFRNRYSNDIVNGMSSRTYCRDIIIEINDLLQTTNFNHLGKYHQTLLSLMINCPNLPEDMLLNIVDNTDLNVRNATGHSPLDAACLSVKYTNPINEAAVVRIYQKSAIENVDDYRHEIKKNINPFSAKINDVYKFVEGFIKIQALSFNTVNTPQSSLKF